MKFKVGDIAYFQNKNDTRDHGKCTVKKVHDRDGNIYHYTVDVPSLNTPEYLVYEEELKPLTKLDKILS